MRHHGRAERSDAHDLSSSLSHGPSTRHRPRPEGSKADRRSSGGHRATSNPVDPSDDHGVAPTGCGDDADESQSAQDAYCEAGDELRTSVDALASLGLVAEGTNGLRSALDAIGADIDRLRSSASEAAEDEIDALDSAIDDAGSALATAGDELTTDNLSAVRTAVEGAVAAARAVYETLSDCP